MKTPNATQWAQSGGQEDIGQIFTQNADFHKGMAQNKTATPPLSFWLPKNYGSELSFEVLCDFIPQQLHYGRFCTFSSQNCLI